MAYEGAGSGPISSLIGSLKSSLSTLIAIVQTRLDIFSTELQEEIGRAANVLLWAFVALFSAGIGLFVGALVLIFAFWETHRVLVSVLVMGFFFLLALFAALMLRARLQVRPRLFEATIAEFSRDLDHLDADGTRAP